MKSRALGLLISSLCVSALADAQTLPASPAAVADSFLARFARKDFLGATELVDPASMEHFHAASLLSARLNDSVQRAVPPRRTDVPPAVADWLESQRRSGGDAYADFFEREFGVATVAELERLTPREVFARWLAARHPEAEFARMVRADPRARELPPIVMQARAPMILGTVAASDSLTYAVFQHQGAPTGTLPSLLPIRLTATGWRIPAGEAEMAIHRGVCSIGFAIVDGEEVP